MCPCVLKGHLSIVCQDVPGSSIVDRHRDESLPIKTASSIVDASKEDGKEDGQIVSLTIEFLFEERDGFVVEFGGRRSRVTEFRQPLQVQSHLEMPGILVQLGHTQHT